MTKPQQYNADPVHRANPPLLYEFPHCGETLSGPPRDYLCPQMSDWGKALWRAAA